VGPRNGGSSATTTALRESGTITIVLIRQRPRAGSHPSAFCTATAHRDVTSLATSRAAPRLPKDHDVAKEELLQFEGLVTEILPDARYRVELDNGHALVAYTAGRMKKNRIKTLAGDRVTVEVSPYDLEKGRLIFRHKDERASAASRPPQRSQFRRR
jgi:translation initiation factor IF-1